MEVIYIVNTCKIPVVHLRVTHWLACTLQFVESCCETVIDNVVSLALLDWEYEVTRCLEEVVWIIMHVVGIYIATALVNNRQDELHLNHADNRTVEQ